MHQCPEQINSRPGYLNWILQLLGRMICLSSVCASKDLPFSNEHLDNRWLQVAMRSFPSASGRQVTFSAEVHLQHRKMLISVEGNVWVDTNQMVCTEL